MASLPVFAAPSENNRSDERSQPRESSPSRILRGFLPTVILPLIVYRLVTAHGMAPAPAFAVAGIAPATVACWSWLAQRRINVLAAAGLLGSAAGLLVALISHSVFLVEAKESLLYALFGIACLGSLLLPRPALFLIGRSFRSRWNLAAGRAFESRWQDAAFRRWQRIATAVWGGAALAFAAVRTVLALLLPVSSFIVVSPILTTGAALLLILWTMRYTLSHKPVGAAGKTESDGKR